MVLPYKVPGYNWSRMNFSPISNLPPARARDLLRRTCNCLTDTFLLPCCSSLPDWAQVVSGSRLESSSTSSRPHHSLQGPCCPSVATQEVRCPLQVTSQTCSERAQTLETRTREKPAPFLLKKQQRNCVVRYSKICLWGFEGHPAPTSCYLPEAATSSSLKPSRTHSQPIWSALSQDIFKVPSFGWLPGSVCPVAPLWEGCEMSCCLVLPQGLSFMPSW